MTTVNPAGVNGGPCVSGNANCPCCGYPTMVQDWRIPELCPECVAYECDAHEPCNVPTEDEVNDSWVYADDPRER